MRIGLVLSGGFLKGAYQVGALRALAENPLAARHLMHKRGIDRGDKRVCIYDGKA